jgi:hypothetical protein
MALTFSLVDTWDDGKRIHVCGTITASASYTTSGDKPSTRAALSIAFGGALQLQKRPHRRLAQTHM